MVCESSIMVGGDNKGSVEVGGEVAGHGRKVE